MKIRSVVLRDTQTDKQKDAEYYSTSTLAEVINTIEMKKN